eukprot:TRINITY_DN2915_c0_g1_i12.p1 TRINITY_DN2915_c0_g1~~TRINITY_DN2915_c0_g1_i12.p1  ORF type:complete len:1129 (+),score=470.31 TRINITY_DN2915_c0_g1_i12:137-3523(+)
MNQSAGNSLDKPITPEVRMAQRTPSSISGASETERAVVPKKGSALPDSGGISGLLTPIHGFGFQSKVADPLLSVESDRLVYVLGRKVVMFDEKSKQMTFVPDFDTKNKTVTALTAYKKYLAIAERISDGGDSETAQISVINMASMRRVSKIKCPEVKEINGISFSTEGRFIAAYSSSASERAADAPDISLMYWNLRGIDGSNVENPIVMSVVKFHESVTRMSVSPHTPGHVVTSGRKFLKLWRQSEGTFQGSSLVLKRDLQDYTDHAWLNGGALAVATETGDVLIFQETELKNTITGVFPNKIGVLSIRVCSRGFVASSSAGHIAVLDRVMSANTNVKAGSVEHQFKVVQYVHTGVDSAISYLSLPADEASVYCLFDNHQIACFPLNMSTIESDSETVQMTQIVATSRTAFHQGAINCLDVCHRKPLFATGGADKTVQVWNYVEKTCEVVKEFDDTPLSMSIHPLGFQVVIGFPTRLRLLYVLADDLHPEHEWPVRNCREVRFSHTGHVIAAVVGNGISIYSTTTYQPLHILKGHLNTVTSLSWADDDKHLASCAGDGAVYVWQTVEPFQRQMERDSVHKGCDYSSVVFAAADDLDHVIACGSDGYIKQLGAGGQAIQVLQGSDPVLKLGFHRGAGTSGIVGGTQEGGTVMFPFPINSPHQAQPPKIVMHDGPMTALRVYGNLLFTGGHDGTVFLLKLPAPDPPPHWTGLEVTMITRSRMDELKQSLKESDSKYNDLKSRTDYEVRLKEVHFEEVAKKQRSTQEVLMQQERARYEDLQKQFMQQRSDYDTKIENLHTDARKELQQLTLASEKKLGDSNQRLEELRMHKESMQKQFEAQVDQLREQQQRQLDQLTAQHQQRMKEENDRYQKLSRELAYVKAEHEEEIEQQEEEYEYDLAAAQENSNKVIQIERDNTMSLKGDNNILRRRCDMMYQEKQILQNQLYDRDTLITKQKKRIVDLEDTIEALRKEVEERNATVGHKEARILEVKQRNQELQKYRFVLDYKINELEDELEPKESEITEMRVQIKAMDEELQRMQKSNDQLLRAINERNLRIDSLSGEIKHLRLVIETKEKSIKLFVEDLHKLYTESDQSKWRQGIKQMYRTYVTQDSTRRITKEDQERMKGPYL